MKSYAIGSGSGARFGSTLPSILIKKSTRWLVGSQHRISTVVLASFMAFVVIMRYLPPLCSLCGGSVAEMATLPGVSPSRAREFYTLDRANSTGVNHQSCRLLHRRASSPGA